MNSRLLPLAFLAATSIASAQVPTHDDVYLGEVPLDAGGSVPLLVDVYLPSNVTGPTPCVIWIHGGGWSTGSHDGMPAAIYELLDSGVALVSASYRKSHQAIFPAQLHDVKGVVRHVRSKAATYNIDPARIGCWGASAGGHLGALLATTGDDPALEGTSGGNIGYSSRIAACVDYFGPTDLLMTAPDVVYPPGCLLDYDAPDSYSSLLIGFNGPTEGVGVLRSNIGNSAWPFQEKLTLIRSANPITHLTADDAPIFIAHGLWDMIVPATQSWRLHDAARAIGLPSVFKIDPFSGHGSLDTSTYAASRAFLLEKLGVGPNSAGVPYCFGDGSSVGCPCANASATTAYAGCLNSSGSAGALRITGSSSLASDTLVLHGSGMLASHALYLAGSGMLSDGAGSTFGDGLMCLSGTLVRVGVRSNVLGASQCPAASEASVTAQCQVSAGDTRYFQVMYRDTGNFCVPGPFNLTNGVAITFLP